MRSISGYQQKVGANAIRWRGGAGLLAVLMGGADGCQSIEEVLEQLESTSTGSADDSTSSTGAITPDVAIDRVPHGIGIVRVVVNQAVGIDLVAAGDVIESESRSAPIIANRAAAVFVMYELAADWHPRSIVATLSVEHGGETTVLTDERAIAIASGDDLTRTFNFYLDAEMVASDSAIRIELAETGLRADVGTPVASPVTVPDGGSALALEAIAGPSDIEVVIVPFDYDDGAGCVTIPDIDAELIGRLSDALYQQLPVDGVEITVHEPEAWNEPFDGWLALNLHLSAIRTADAVEPQVIYYGLMDPCVAPGEAPLGMAYGVPTDPSAMDAAFQRCAVGLWHSDQERVARTFIHEVSHTLGRGHAECNNEGFPVDPLYPVEGGDLDTWGFGVLDHMIRPQHVTKDFMTYCDPSWASAYGWRLMQPIVHTLASWGGKGAAPGRLLLGAISPGGTRTWRVVEGRIPTHLGARSVRLTAAVDGAPLRLDGWSFPVADEPAGTLVVAAVPDGATTVEVADESHVGERKLAAGRTWTRAPR